MTRVSRNGNMMRWGVAMYFLVAGICWTWTLWDFVSCHKAAWPHLIVPAYGAALLLPGALLWPVFLPSSLAVAQQNQGRVCVIGGFK